jgi:eukaryotic-like serine/threonine-protein kinase
MSAIPAGTKLGRYEIRAKIGEGGMGEVYLARDTQLGRDVAVKVLPSTYADDKERLQRFEQEACAASALNHPNILSIYDVGTHEGAPYVVSELLEGQTLRQRLNGAQLPQRKTIDYALKIAHGLAAAHEKGIVHRDLKPDNLFITNDGRLKILDFGLAKLTGAGDTQLSQTSIPTRRVDTDPGKVMGTVGYMSPEQVKGRAVDHRSDIFSFGAILYEMLSGRRAFHGESAAETMSAILKEDPPDLSETNQRISPALERLVNHCLEKNPEERFHSASDLAFALEALSGSSSGVTQTTEMVSATTQRWIRRHPIAGWIVAASVLLLAVLAVIFVYFRRAPTAETTEATRFTIPLPEKSVTIGPPLISPDGRRLIFRLTTEDGKEFLWMRPLASLDARPLAGTESGTQPFWSPDSRSIAFFSGGKLKRLDLPAGAPQTLCDAPSNVSGTWGTSGWIVFSRGVTDGIYRVRATGGTPERVTQVDASHNELEHTWPVFLPDGRHFLYLARNAQPENSAIYVGSIDSKETKRLLQAHSSAEYAPGYLLFARENTLVAQGFDISRLEMKGDAFPIAEQVPRNPQNGRAMFSVSENGVLALRTGGLVQNELVWFDRTGKQLGEVTSPGSYSSPSFSADDKRVAVRRADQSNNSDIWLIDLERGVPTRFTTDLGLDNFPAWSPDGSLIAFISTRNGQTSIYQKSASGAGAEEALITSAELKYNPQWSPDGRFILYAQISATTNVDLLLLPLSGERKAQPFLQTSFIEAQGRFSPDGRWVAYISNETIQFEVYVQSFPASNGKVRISTGGGSQPQWRGDGRELYYYTPDRKLMAVDVNGEGSTFKVGVPRPLFNIRVVGAGIDQGFPGNGYYAATRDGKRFLVTTSPEAGERQQINVILNWTADLKR